MNKEKENKAEAESVTVFNDEDIKEEKSIMPVPKPFDILNDSPEWLLDMTVAVFGQRGSGKTFFVTQLCYLIRNIYPYIYVFTETKQNCWWAQFVNPDCIFEGYNERALSMILEDQAAKTNAWREGKFKGNPFALIIWDDCLPQNMQWDELFKKIYFYGRHSSFCNIMLSQYWYTIPKGLRGNLDLIVVFNQEMWGQLHGMTEDLMGRRVDFTMFAKMNDIYASGRQFLAFWKRDRTTPIFERIYTGLAYDPGNFFMGSEEYWKDNPRHLHEEILTGRAREKANKKFDLKEVGIDWKEIKKQLIEEEKKYGTRPEQMLKKAKKSAV